MEGSAVAMLLVRVAEEAVSTATAAVAPAEMASVAAEMAEAAVASAVAAVASAGTGAVRLVPHPCLASGRETRRRVTRVRV